MRHAPTVLVSFVSACTFTAPGPAGFAGPDVAATTATSDETGPPPDPATTGGSSSGGGTTTGAPAPPRFDLGGGADIPEAAPCPGIDVLFVIDDSYSMADEQANLVASFPGFSDGLLALVDGGLDVHVGVVTTDAYAFNEAGCTMVGALTTRTGGTGSSNAMCAPFSEGRYLTGADDLVADFACAAQVGTEGDPKERPVLAALEALAPTNLGEGGCNAGFRRAGAVFVTVIVTDEDDLEDTPGTPGDWYEDLVARAGGDPARVIVLSLVGHPKPNLCPPFQWNGSEGAQIASQLIEFTELFGPNGMVGDVCAPDYAPFFDEALALIETTCDALPAG